MRSHYVCWKGWVENAKLHRSDMHKVIALKHRTSTDACHDHQTLIVITHNHLNRQDRSGLHLCEKRSWSYSRVKRLCSLPVDVLRHLAETLCWWSHKYISIWGRVVTDKYHFFATQIKIVLFTNVVTHIAADNLICVESLHVGFQLTKIPYQGAHASWQGVHAIHKMT